MKEILVKKIYESLDQVNSKLIATAGGVEYLWEKYGKNGIALCKIIVDDKKGCW